MSNASEQHALTQVAPNLPIPGVPFDPRAVEVPQQDPGFDFKGYLNTLYDSRWLIGGITALITLVALLYALVAKQVY